MKDACKADKYDILSDRIRSLLDRWDKFHEEHPELRGICIAGLMSEINYGFTKALMEE